MKRLILIILLIASSSCGGGDALVANNGKSPNGGGVVITTPDLPSANRGYFYSYQLQASGGSGDYLWTVKELPQGLTATNSGLISGTPTQSGQFKIQVKVVAE